MDHGDIAHWKIRQTGEKMSVLVTKNPEAFRRRIESHTGLEWVGWGSSLNVAKRDSGDSDQ